MFGKGLKKDKINSRSFRWMSAGIEFCGVIALFCWAGFEADKRLGTTPLFFMLGFFISFVGMTYLFYKDSK